ncbi:TPA: winged helix-turn-helix domain-containing protein [Klebsiella pneumoniae]
MINVLIIEDEHAIRRFLRTALEADGMRVFEAETLQRGLIEAATRKPDLAILDLGLPDGDGIDFIRDLRQWSQMPIIVLSARSEEIHLTPIEFRLLAALLNNPGKVLTQRQLLNQVWGPNAVEHSHYLRIYMGHLRQKLEADPARPQHLLTETGIGYRFMP